MICPSCGKNESRKAGFSIFKESRNQRLECKQCGHKWTTLGGINPKLLYFDIETTHMEFKGWRPGKQYVPASSIKKDWIILAWAAKWVCTTSMYSMVLRPKEVKHWDDKRIVKGLYDLFNQADILIGHNADQFDIKKMNWRFMVHGLKPPKPYKTVDTLKIARRVTGASSKSLDFMMKELGLGNGKIKMHDEDWDACEAGDPAALRKMRMYNEKDVLDGEALYLKIRPWDQNHPNMGLYYETNKSRCKNCGSSELDFDETVLKYTPANVYHCWTCLNCGANGRTPESARYEMTGDDKEENKIIREENKEKRLNLMR